MVSLKTLSSCHPRYVYVASDCENEENHFVHIPAELRTKHLPNASHNVTV
jgi:hypothetical protein